MEGILKSSYIVTTSFIDEKEYIGDGKWNLSYYFYDKDNEQSGKYQIPYEEIGSWKRTEFQVRDEVAYGVAFLMSESLKELGKLAFEFLASSLCFVSADKEQQNKSRWKDEDTSAIMRRLIHIFYSTMKKKTAYQQIAQMTRNEATI